MEKLKLIGLEDGAVAWFGDYLRDRQQFVQLNKIESNKRKITYGVPQGSILGPTLFLIYINSLSQLDLKGSIKLYADDTTLLYSSDSCGSVVQNIRHDLELILHWLQSHKLTLNIKKSAFMWVANKNNDLGEIHFNNDIIRHSSKIQFLGLTIDNKMNWGEYIKAVRKRITGPIGVLNRLSHIVPKNLTRSLYFSLVHSHLQYLTIIWGKASKRNLKPLNILQKKAIKKLYSLDYRYPTTDLFNNFKIRNINSTYKLQINIFIHQTLMQKRHTQVTFAYRRQVHSHFTRQCTDLSKPQVCSRQGINSIYFDGVAQYNTLPKHFKNQNVDNFKKRIRQYIPLYC